MHKLQGITTTWLGIAAVGATFAAACALGFTHSETRETAHQSGDVPAQPPIAVEACGGGSRPDFETRLELAPGSSQGRIRLTVVSDNHKASQVRVAHAIQLMDGFQTDLLAPTVTAAELAPSRQATRSREAVVDASTLKDGYYHLMAQTMGDQDAIGSNGSSVPVASSAGLYIAIENGSVRRVEFTEWYAKSGAATLRITENRVGKPTGAVAEALARMAEQSKEAP